MRLGHQTRRTLTRLAGRASIIVLALCGLIAGAPSGTRIAAQIRPAPAPVPAPVPDVRTVLDTYCITCHNQRLRTGGLALDRLDVTNPGANAEVWENVIAKLRAGSMPPAGRPRPDAATYRAVAGAMENDIDRAWAASPNPGRINAVHRLNRTEYQNAIRDLFALDIDVRSLLPGDETADGSFDNFATSLSISTVHLERYMSVARQVTRLATGLPPARPTMETFEIPLHVVQDDRQSEDLPFGSRGGIAIHHDFPVDGEYLIKVRLQRQYQDYLKGMGWPQRLDVRLDARLLKRFTVGGARARQARRDQLCRRRRAELRRRSRMGKVHAARRRRGSGAPRPGAGRAAPDRRVVREGTVGAGRPPAATAAGQGHHGRQRVHESCERGLGPDRWPLHEGWTGEGHAKPSRDFRLSAQASG